MSNDRISISRFTETMSYVRTAILIITDACYCKLHCRALGEVPLMQNNGKLHEHILEVALDREYYFPMKRHLLIWVKAQVRSHSRLLYPLQ